MALNESLNKFKQQQVKCQATLSSIAPRGKTTKSNHPEKFVSGSSSLVPKAPVPGVKFSNDTERLQHINSIRKSPVGAQIKRVIDLLLETRQAFTAEQINEVCYVDITSNKAVFDSLRNNPKVRYENKYFSYKSKHDVKDKNQLLVLIRKFPEGIAVVDLKDAYPTIMEDLQESLGNKLMWHPPKLACSTWRVLPRTQSDFKSSSSTQKKFQFATSVGGTRSFSASLEPPSSGTSSSTKPHIRPLTH